MAESVSRCGLELLLRLRVVIARPTTGERTGASSCAAGPPTSRVAGRAWESPAADSGVLLLLRANLDLLRGLVGQILDGLDDVRRRFLDLALRLLRDALRLSGLVARQLAFDLFGL